MRQNAPRIILALALIIALGGCAGIDITTDNTHATLVLINITAREVGCEIARIEDPAASREIDRALRNFYELAYTGELSEDGIKQLNDTLAIYAVDRPTLIPNLISLLSLIDVDFNAEETMLDELRVIAPEYFDQISRGYISGFNLCMP
jgi:hypothetical protein